MGEWYVTGWGEEHYGRGNPGEDPEPQERQSAITGEVERRRGGCHRKLPEPERAHAHGLSVVWAALAQTIGGKKPLARLGETGCFLCKLPVARYLFYGLRALEG